MACGRRWLQGVMEQCDGLAVEGVGDVHAVAVVICQDRRMAGAVRPSRRTAAWIEESLFGRAVGWCGSRPAPSAESLR